MRSLAALAFSLALITSHAVRLTSLSSMTQRNALAHDENDLGAVQQSIAELEKQKHALEDKIKSELASEVGKLEGEVKVLKETRAPSRAPTVKPTAKPTAKPTGMPTTKPTVKPTEKPTKVPTGKPTWKPTEEEKKVTGKNVVVTGHPTAQRSMAPHSAKEEDVGALVDALKEVNAKLDALQGQQKLLEEQSKNTERLTQLIENEQGLTKQAMNLLSSQLEKKPSS